MSSAYSLSSRLNNIIFYGVIVLGIMGAMNFATGYFTTKSVYPKFEFHNFTHFVNDRYIGVDDTGIIFSFDVDLSQLFDWNTHMLFVWISAEYEDSALGRNQATLWDRRVLRESPEEHHITLRHVESPYTLTDHYHHLASQNLTLYFNYEHIPIIGINYKDRIKVAAFQMPSKYVGLKKSE